jgi:hypothetical protein
MISFLRLRGAINQHDMGPQLSPLDVTWLVVGSK